MNSWHPVREWAPIDGIIYVITDGYIWGIGIPHKNPFTDKMEWESITHRITPTHWMKISVPEPDKQEKDS